MRNFYYKTCSFGSFGSVVLKMSEQAFVQNYRIHEIPGHTPIESDTRRERYALGFHHHCQCRRFYVKPRSSSLKCNRNVILKSNKISLTFETIFIKILQ